MSARRTLEFARLDEVMPEVDRLLRGGYRPAGDWSLGQACGHLALSVRCSVEGFPIRVPWPVRATLGRVAKRRLLATSRMPAGIKLPPSAVPAPRLDDRAEAEAYRAALMILGRQVAPMAAHPFFGPMSHDDWRRFHTIHAAHHLSYLIPEG